MRPKTYGTYMSIEAWGLKWGTTDTAPHFYLKLSTNEFSSFVPLVCFIPLCFIELVGNMFDVCGMCIVKRLDT